MRGDGHFRSYRDQAGVLVYTGSQLRRRPGQSAYLMSVESGWGDSEDFIVWSMPSRVVVRDMSEE